MKLKENNIWKLFSSVRLALFIISILALTSIIGTILPQGEQFGFYIERYGPKNAMIIELLALSNMYYSFWFKTLLAVFCLNLIICTYTRLPITLKLIKKDNIDINPLKFKTDNNGIVLFCRSDRSTVVNSVKNGLDKLKIRTKQKDDGKDYLFLHERGAWTRLGAYIVHISILLIVLGAIIGNKYGYKAFVMVPEGKSVDYAYSRDDGNKPIPLQFDVFCRDFSIEYYQNGTPKEYKSDLTILEKGNEVLKKNITVNDPLTYKGVTFYQSSYQPIPNEYAIAVQKQENKDSSDLKLQKKNFFIKAEMDNDWDDTKAIFKIVATSEDGHGHGPYKIWFDDEDKKPVTFVTNDNAPYLFERNTGSYSFTINQRYATGLQVVKDPGVWIVYTGCGLMLFGLFVSFFMSHRNIWVSVAENGHATTIFIGGRSNKNHHGLFNMKEVIASMLQSDESLLELRRV